MGDTESSGGFTRAAAATSWLWLWGHRTFDRPEWHALAACGRNGVIGDDPAERVRIMFPARGEGSTKARQVCERCPVTEQCERANQGVELRHARDVGVWFGTSGNMRRDKPRAATCRCGAQFTPSALMRAYCSEECRAEARRIAQQRYMAQRRTS